MFRKKLLFSIVFIASLLIISSCDPNSSLQVDLTGIEQPDVDIKRYEKAMFAIPEDSFIQELETYRQAFPLFISGDLTDTLALLNLKSFFADPYMIELNDMVQIQFKDLSIVEDELANAMQHYYYYFDSPSSFSYYSYISGLDIQYPVKIIDSNIVIGLDLYLGAKSKVYTLSGYPKYKSQWLKPEAIVPDVMSELVRSMIPEKDRSSSLLQQMIYDGKRLYFIQAMMPHISDSLLMHYSSSQMEWCLKNEANLWSLMVENQYLFKNDVQIQKKFMDDAPFTSIFSTEAPARLGQFIGWRLVSAFMAKSEYSLPELLAEEDVQLILKGSKYKPKL